MFSKDFPGFSMVFKMFYLVAAKSHSGRRTSQFTRCLKALTRQLPAQLSVVSGGFWVFKSFQQPGGYWYIIKLLTISFLIYLVLLFCKWFILDLLFEAF